MELTNEELSAQPAKGAVTETDIFGTQPAAGTIWNKITFAVIKTWINDVVWPALKAVFLAANNTWSGTNYFEDAITVIEPTTDDNPARKKDLLIEASNVSLFDPASTFNADSEWSEQWKNGVKGIWLDEFDETKFYTFWKIQVQTSNTQIFIAEVADKVTPAGVSDIICQYNFAVTKSGIETINLTEYSGSGRTATMIVNWDELFGTSHGSFAYEVAGIDLTYLLHNKKQSEEGYVTPSKQYVWREDNEVWIAAKWDFDNDILIKFDNDELNNRMVFRRVGLASSVGEISTDIKRTPTTIITEVEPVADNIGPFKNSAGYWTGGGHQYPTNTSDPKYPTADLLERKIYADGVFIPEKTLVLCDEVQIYTNHELYDPASTPTTPVVVLHEKLSFNIRGGNIETMCEFECINSITVADYYGMQSLTGAWQDKMYFAHSGTDNSIQNWTTSTGAGNLSQSPNLEKAILCNADRSICLAMSMEIDKGILTERGTTLDASDSVLFTSGTKTYWRLIGKNTSYTTGDRKYWRGVYNYFKNYASGADFAYFQCEGNNKYLIIDFVDSSSDDYKIFVPGIQNQDIEITNKDTTLTVDTVVKPDGVDITITGYGNAKLKVN